MFFGHHHRRRIQHRHALLAKVGIIAGAGQRVLAPRGGLLPFGPYRRDILLDEGTFERGPNAAGRFDFLELLPGGAAKLSSQVFDGAGAGGGIADFRQIDSSSRMSCVLRATRRAKASGRPSARVCGSATMLSAPPRPAAVTAMSCAACSRRHRAWSSSATRSRRRRKRASVQARRLPRLAPTVSERYELGDGEKFVGVRRHPEIDHAARGIERHAVRGQRAQIFHGAGDRERQFLRFGTAGIMDDTAVSDRERPAESLTGQFAHQLGEVFRQVAPRPRARARRRQSRRSD